MAGLPVAFLAPGAAAFPAAPSQSATLHVGGGFPASQLDGTFKLGISQVACGLAAAAAVGAALALKRRRGVIATRVLDRAIQVVEWQVDPKTPVPGSQKAAAAMVGGDVETGGVWDPLGFSKLYDRNFDFNMIMTYPHVQWLRESELKHGRICMLAFVGTVVQQFFQIPGYPTEPDWTKALDACYAEKLPTLGVIQISVFAMLVEGRWFPDGAWLGQMDREPGDLGFDPLKLAKKSGFNLKEMQLKEIKNGRLAMIGLAGMAANHALPGSVPLLTGVSYAARPEDSSTGKAVTFCGETRSTAWQVAEMKAKTAAQYTTKKILPSLAWIKTGLKSSDLAPRQLIAKTLSGSDVLIGKTEAGKLFCVGNNCPHLGTPMSEGADVIGDVIVCPLHGSSFKTSNGELIDWCPSPPIIGPLTGLVTEKTNLAVLQVREGSGFFGGSEIEVQVDTNAKKAYEADYWKGLLDAQGKVDGTYY